ncbi:MAG: prepilin-type N-terminal cleavage/methylation domain-containing protein [Proteobacteria bacterium]|nr:prepilin-type N-terminal cleavage/methylation domain-containing protein [Pseudomonadota bacterium]
MKDRNIIREKQRGFTLIEVVMVIAIIAILLTIAVPAINGWLPNYRLKSAARDLYSTFQMARMEAVKANERRGVSFDAAAGTYQILSSGDDGTFGTADDPAPKTAVVLSDYGSGVSFGPGNADFQATGGAFPGAFNGIKYTGDLATFNSRGLMRSGTIYLQNNSNLAQEERSTYAVRTLSTGRIFLLKWFEASGNWE